VHDHEDSNRATDNAATAGMVCQHRASASNHFDPRDRSRLIASCRHRRAALKPLARPLPDRGSCAVVAKDSPDGMVGMSVVEVGVRSCWSFIMFADYRPAKGPDRRIYIESGVEVQPPGAACPGETLESQCAAMVPLVGRTVESVHVSDAGRLTICFAGDVQLIVFGDWPDDPRGSMSPRPWEVVPEFGRS